MASSDSLDRLATLIGEEEPNKEVLAETMTAVYQHIDKTEEPKSEEEQETKNLTCEKLLSSIDKFKRELRSHALMKRYGSVFEKMDDFEGLEPSVENVREILTMSHRLAYSAFAPRGHEMGDHLRSFKPPAPQAPQFLASKLHDFDKQYRSMSTEIHTGIEEEDSAAVVAKKAKLEIECMSSMEETSSADEAVEEDIKSDVMDAATPVEKPELTSFLLNPDLEEIESESDASSSENDASD